MMELKVDDIVIAIGDTGPIKYSSIWIVNSIAENGVVVQDLEGATMTVFNDALCNFRKLPDGAKPDFVGFSVAIRDFRSRMRGHFKSLLGEIIDDGRKTESDGK